MNSKRWLPLTAFLLLAALTLPAAQAPPITITPDQPDIAVGETQQFTANGMSTPATIDAGGDHACMLMSDRSVRCFGRNQWGQLGDGHFFTNASTPVPVVGLTTAIDVGAGMEHSCSVLADGTMRCWGTRYVGQLGDGSNDGLTDVPVAVQNLTGAIAGVVGGFHTCAILSDRSMRCWGFNEDGQVGNGATAFSANVPQAVVGVGGPVSAATAGGYHTCALLPDSTVRCWGRNTRGQLGNGTSISSSTPVAVSGLTNVAAVSGGGYHTCALRRDGTVQCWGENDRGQIGNTLAFSNVPVTVAGISTAVAISTGFLHSCAILADGTTRCWGHNNTGQLGNGTTTNSSSPVPVTGLSGPMQIAAGGTFDEGHSCVMMPDRRAKCWGDNAFGQLGNGTTTDSGSPVNVSGTGGLTWTSSHPAVATIDAAGLATGVGAGTTTITATDGSGSASTTLTVTQPTTRVTLSTIRQGSGTGTISSNPAGIACGTDCTEDYDSGTTVTLTASAAAGSAFASWNGCDTASGATCTVTMNAARTATATFTLTQQTFALTVSKSGTGAGTVTSSPAGINCGADCSQSYNSGTTVTLTAAASAGSTFASWNGCDTASGATCTVSMTAAKTVTATFTVPTFMLTVGKAGAGGGTVTSSPAGISCGADCSQPYTNGTTVTLTATPAAGSVFGSWTGCNSVSGATCTVAMNAAKSVTATFNLQFFSLTVSKSGLGSGTVTSSPAGISCGSTCSASFASNVTVTLTANPGLLSAFVGWSGCDSVSGNTCTVATNRARSVTAAFRLLGLL
jgi:alpha-tubulin suppressor-like RCC1 family protein